MTNVMDAAAPQSPPNVFQGKWPNGLPSGYTSIKFEGWDDASGGSNYGTEMSQVYLSMWIKLVGTDYENEPRGTKLGFFSYGESKAGAGNQGILFLKGTGAQTTASAWSLQFSQQDSASGGVDRDQNVDTRQLMTSGEWHHWEIVLALNDPGTANGVFRWWIDGTMILDYANVVYRDAQRPLGFYCWKFWPYWGGFNPTDSKTRDDFVQIDHVYLSGIVK